MNDDGSKGKVGVSKTVLVFRSLIHVRILLVSHSMMGVIGLFTEDNEKDKYIRNTMRRYAQHKVI